MYDTKYRRMKMWTFYKSEVFFFLMLEELLIWTHKGKHDYHVRKIIFVF